MVEGGYAAGVYFSDCKLYGGISNKNVYNLIRSVGVWGYVLYIECKLHLFSMCIVAALCAPVSRCYRIILCAGGSLPVSFLSSGYVLGEFICVVGYFPRFNPYICGSRPHVHSCCLWATNTRALKLFLG